MRIASRGSVVRKKVIAGAILFGLALLAFGCGGGDNRSAQAVKWGVFRQLGPRQVKLVATVEYCGDGQGPTLERPVIEYSGRRVFIELLLAPEEESDDGGCLLSLLGATKTVTLKRDLDELVLYDSSTDPPERRWPTG